jgi:hypothetical protein
VPHVLTSQPNSLHARPTSSSTYIQATVLMSLAVEPTGVDSDGGSDPQTTIRMLSFSLRRRIRGFRVFPYPEALPQ